MKSKLKIVNHISELVGDTPVVKLQRIVPSDCADVYVKLEYFNPSGSVKDRAALNLIRDAQSRGLLKEGSTIIEPTSGNTGIGLAMNGAAFGYRVILVMPNNMSKERISLLKAYGAEVVLSDSTLKMKGALDKAHELARDIPDAYIPNQFENGANPEIHRQTTAKELLEQFDNRLEAFIASAGTGGTITGTGEVLKKELPHIHIAVVEPQGSPVLSGGQPGSHKLVGTSPGFIPAILNQSIYDEIIQVSDTDALQTMRKLAKQEGLLLGPSSGATVWAAIEVAKRLGEGKKVVCVAPDTGERYLSTGIFEE